VETTFWEALTQLSWGHQAGFACALIVAFGFEFINGFHDTANAVTTGSTPELSSRRPR